MDSAEPVGVRGGSSQAPPCLPSHFSHSVPVLAELKKYGLKHGHRET